MQLTKENINKFFILFNNKKYYEAKSFCLSLIKKFPRHHFVWLALGNVYLQNDMLNDALLSFKKSLSIDWYNCETHFNVGLTLYKLGRLKEAEKSYKNTIDIKYDFDLAHTNLANILCEMGRYEEAERYYKNVIKFKPKYPTAYYNLAIFYLGFKRIEYAKTLFEDVIKLNSNFIQAYYHLSNIYLELGKIEDAKFLLRNIIELNPDAHEAYFNLGNIFKEARMWKDAEINFRTAININKTIPEYYNNLALVLEKNGNLKEVLFCYNRALTLNKNFTLAMVNLALNLEFTNNFKEAEILYLNSLKLDDKISGYKAAVNLAVIKFTTNDYVSSKKLLSLPFKTRYLESNDCKSEKIYHSFILKLLNLKEFQIRKENVTNLIYKKIYVIGESHSLVSNGLKIKICNINYFCQSLLIKGCKLWHIGQIKNNRYKTRFNYLFSSIPKSSYLVISLGEIDCRIDTGFSQISKIFSKKLLNINIENTIKKFFLTICNLNINYNHKIFIQGVPCPNVEGLSNADMTKLTYIIEKCNHELRIMSKEMEYEFLDLHKITNRGDGFSNKKWHIDNYHLTPLGMKKAWQLLNLENFTQEI